MLCDRCAAVLEEPKFSRISFQNLRKATAERDFEILHPDHSSFEAALSAECGICHRILDNVTSKKRSKIFSDHQLCADIEIASFCVQYRIAYESESRRLISYLCVFHARKAGKAVHERSTVFLFLAPGKESWPCPYNSILTINRANAVADQPHSVRRQ